MSTKPGTLSTISGRLSTCSVKRLSTTSGNKGKLSIKIRVVDTWRCKVAVLQFIFMPIPRLKICLYIIYINIYKYIGYIFHIGEGGNFNCNDATRNVDWTKTVKNVGWKGTIFWTCLFSCLFCDLICKTHDFFVPLHCRKERSESRPLRIKIVTIKSRNCAH